MCTFIVKLFNFFLSRPIFIIGILCIQEFFWPNFKLIAIFYTNRFLYHFYQTLKVSGEAFALSAQFLATS